MLHRIKQESEVWPICLSKKVLFVRNKSSPVFLLCCPYMSSSSTAAALRSNLLAEIASKSMEKGTPVLWCLSTPVLRVYSTDLVHPNVTTGNENLKIFEIERRPKKTKTKYLHIESSTRLLTKLIRWSNMLTITMKTLRQRQCKRQTDIWFRENQ